MTGVDDQIHRAIRIWQKARNTPAHPKFIVRLGENVKKLLQEKRDLETENTIA